MVDDKVAYMTFFKGLQYKKLKKAFLVQTPLTKNDLTTTIITHIELEELKVGVGPVDFRETVLRKDGNVSPKKLPIWERIQRDRGQLARKPYKGTFLHRRMVRHIATIAGGIHRGVDSRNSRKKYVRREVYGVMNTQVNTEAIIFTDTDYQGLEMTHDDPLVIVQKRAHFTMERMLVDTGSSAKVRRKSFI
ncbi:hypothetical protein LIER_10867 [Lithospermum erythrorhizon]|uniref:Uncharacterized protein n=1 Tax=Lithospermum erythrorhizon TaxID=34254 RepID=A0AAV3PMY0_LITER